MGSYSKAGKARTANLFQNLTNRTQRAWDELGTSPKKIWKWFSPRKKHKEDTTDDTDSQTRIGDASDASIHVFDASDDPFDASDTSDDPFQDAGFVNCSHRFGDGYFNHNLTGPQAAWIAKNFPAIEPTQHLFWNSLTRQASTNNRRYHSIYYNSYNSSTHRGLALASFVMLILIVFDRPTEKGNVTVTPRDDSPGL
ncbi:hypothetical protein B0H10DRAFT_1962760 [Mycena sp. CBHHK59/15]|nr:hypothetical protein B0H10DRAFT_1962760 [Mycena sp. CBHHK59/15]